MSNKMLLHLNNETYDKIILAYCGARTIQPNMTKSGFMTSITENLFNNKNSIIMDSNFNTYSFEELYRLCISKIKQYYKDLLSRNDINFFYSEIKLMGADILANSQSITTYAIKKVFQMYLSETDQSILVDIIHPSKIYKKAPVYEQFVSKNYDDPILLEKEYELFISKTGYESFGLGNDKEYWVIEETADILSRYRKIKNNFNYYSILTKFIFNQIDKLNLSSKYKFINPTETKASGNDSLEFYYEFFKELESTYFIEEIPTCGKSLNILKEFSKEEINSLILINIENILKKKDAKFYNFTISKYLYYLIQDDLKKIISVSLSLDYKEYLETHGLFGRNDFEYYTRAFIELINERQLTNYSSREEIIAINNN